MNLFNYVGANPINWFDPQGLFWQELLQEAGNLAAGFGDFISFGGTAKIRRLWEENLDWQDPTNFCSFNYRAGNILGETWWAASASEFTAGWRWMPNAKGFEKMWSKDFRTGWHRLPESKKWWSGKNLPHYHRRPGIGKHRPYQGGF